MYEGISKSPLTELIMKYMLTFLIGHCYHLQSDRLPSLCSGSNVSAIAGSTIWTGILESRVGQSAIVAEC